jgi:hypothetical protein
MTEMSQEQLTIVEQLKSLGVFRKWKVKGTTYNSDKSDGSEWDIRLLIREPGLVVNIDITLDRGDDLYNVKGYLIRNSGVHIDEIYDGSGLFWEQLHEVVDRAMANAAKMKATGTIAQAVDELVKGE